MGDTNTDDDQNDLLFNSIVQPAAKIFMTLYRTKNFSKTAKLLKISQPSISRNISSLENTLGVSLVDRDNRPIRFTREGKMLYQLLDQELYNFHNSLLEISQKANRRIPLRFGCVGSLGGHTTPAVLKRLSSEVSTITLYYGTSFTLKEKLDRGELDVFISSRPFFDSNNLYRRFLYTEPPVVIVPKSLRLPNKVTWQTMRFCGLPRIRNMRGTSNTDFENQYFNQLDLDFVEKIIIEQPLPFLTCIAEGIGWGMCDLSLLGLFPHLWDKIKVLPMPEPVICRDVYVLSRKEPLVRHLADQITNIASEAIRNVVRKNLIHLAPWTKDQLLIASAESKHGEKIF